MLTRLLAGIWSSLNAAAARNPRERAQAYAVRLQPQALSILEQAGRQVAAGVAVDSALEPLVTPVSGCDRHRQEPERVARPTLEAIAADHRAQEQDLNERREQSAATAQGLNADVMDIETSADPNAQAHTTDLEQSTSTRRRIIAVRRIVGSLMIAATGPLLGFEVLLLIGTFLSAFGAGERLWQDQVFPVAFGIMAAIATPVLVHIAIAAHLGDWIREHIGLELGPLHLLVVRAGCLAAAFLGVLSPAVECRTNMERVAHGPLSTLQMWCAAVIAVAIAVLWQRGLDHMHVAPEEADQLAKGEAELASLRRTSRKHLTRLHRATNRRDKHTRNVQKEAGSRRREVIKAHRAALELASERIAHVWASHQYGCGCEDTADQPPPTATAAGDEGGADA